MTRAPSRTLPRPAVLTAGPWVGMCDAREPTVGRADKVAWARNMYVDDGPFGRAYVAVPGFTPLGSALAGTPTPQGLASWAFSTAAPRLLQAAGGQVYEYDYSTTARGVVVNTATFVGAGAALSTSAPVTFTPGPDGLVISDGVTSPFRWDGTTNAGLAQIGACPPLYGQPVVYASKLFGIKATERDTFVWSREGDTTSGYEPNNAWAIPLAGQAPLTALAATNEALFIFRERSIVTVSGLVDDDFRSQPTRAASESIGTASWRSVRVLRQGVFFVDADGLPRLVVQGGDPIDLSADCRTTIRELPRTRFGDVVTVEDPTCGLLRVGYCELDTSVPSRWLLFDLETLQFEGVRDGVLAAQCAAIETNTRAPRLVHAHPTNGFLYLHGTPTAGPWADQLTATPVGATKSIPCELAPAALGRDLSVEHFFDELEIGFTGGQASRVTVTAETPRGNLRPVSVPVPGGFGTRLGVFRLGTDRLGGITREQRVRVGLNVLGRWVVPAIAHAESSAGIGITDVRVRAFADGDEPGVA